MARRLLESSGAAAVVGLGGFSSYAPVKAAAGLGLPVFLLEQNAAPGVANVRLARRATLVCLAWETSATRLPAGARFEVTGNPLRRDLVEAAARTAYSPGGGILILGGSTGAVGLNTLVTGAAKALGELGRPIVHQTGAQDFERVREAYRAAGVEATVSQYIDDMAGAYSKAAVVIARAGGTTLSELALFGLPVVLIPYPYHKDNHQMLNARIFTEAGAGEIIEEKKNTSADLARVVAGLAGDSGRLERMHAAARRIARPEAAETVASRIWAAIEGAQAAAQETL
jgi:UDP-N-acetylglucosamine--N-acetylmuramyl-(pentapeptide) pyrophosphoryl-undecaprenol N-acetylglucosamine transferase